ncbi:hypothetical protein SKAU_G00278520 [Synaphobranchus kaupii]|uniref:Uncharacterized protein n=1 Tax=Synaphobranchus kaupii TaxID=118154 RepID=A0A9Q1ING2_SYNKA|nr:hypothetical protein SKAU_G00278520 [Synaphobranchus kaupii]
MQSSLRDVEESIKVEIKKAETDVREDVQAETSDLTALVNQVKVTMGQVAVKLELLDTVCQMVTDLAANSQVTT